MVKENGPHIVQMPIQREQTSPCLVRPDLDLVVIAARDEEGLCLVEIDSSNWAIMFFESVNERPHAVVPELDRRGMEGDEDPWSKSREWLVASRKWRGKRPGLTFLGGTRGPLHETILTQTVQRLAYCFVILSYLHAAT